MMIRLLNPADAEEYSRLRIEALQENPEAFSSSYEELIRKPNLVAEYRRNFQENKSYTYGAFKDGVLIGMVTLIPEGKEKLKHKATIFAMYVTPGHRGNGIGKALLEAAISQAREIEGIKKINLGVVSINRRAKELYVKSGFNTYGVEEKALKIKNVYFDEEYMTLFLSEEKN
jgi:ribosomal protein S18 acetylase RimI-like enzyme